MTEIKTQRLTSSVPTGNIRVLVIFSVFASCLTCSKERKIDSTGLEEMVAYKKNEKIFFYFSQICALDEFRSMIQPMKCQPNYTRRNSRLKCKAFLPFSLSNYHEVLNEYFQYSCSYFMLAHNFLNHPACASSFDIKK